MRANRVGLVGQPHAARDRGGPAHGKAGQEARQQDSKVGKACPPKGKHTGKGVADSKKSVREANTRSNSRQA